MFKTTKLISALILTLCIGFQSSKATEDSKSEENIVLPHRSNPTRDNVLHPIPLQDRPYLLKVTCHSPHEWIPKYFYIWFTLHNFPIEATIPFHKRKEIIESCYLRVGELKVDSFETDKDPMSRYKTLEKKGLLLKGENKTRFIEQMAKIRISHLTDFEWSEFGQIAINARVDDNMKHILTTSPQATEKIRGLFIKSEEEKLEIQKRLFYQAWEINLSTWADILPLEVKQRIQEDIGERFDINELHPAR